MIFLRLSLFLFLGLLFYPSLHAEDSFTKDRSVVIVMGLPGDMESETKFTDEATQLVSLLNDARLSPKSILLLSYHGKPVTVTSAVPLEVLPDNRETFLGLAAKLKDEKTAPVFFVFGHGGNQGDKPVFHVPGPRLAPDDFNTIAKNFLASTWLLFFPGSGLFAQALQAPQRTILATEADDKHFQQDPVAFNQFLAVLKNETSLNQAAEQLGKATDQWYQSRGLARTEEPALWVNGEAPRKLIRTDGATAKATAPAPTPPTAPVPVPALKTVAPDTSWNGIAPAKPSDYPNDDAVILSRSESFVLGDDTQVTEDEETFVQILKREGKRFGDFNFTFTPPSEDLVFLACEVRLPDGTVQSLDANAIREGADAPVGDYGGENRKMFSLPQVEPGAIIHLHLQRQWKRFPFPHVFEEIPLTTEIPTRFFQIEARLPEKAAFHYQISHLPFVEPTQVKTDYGNVYTWQFHNLPTTVDEPLQPADQNPTLIFTTFADWGSFATWYGGIIRDSNQPSPEMTAQAAELASGAKTDREKIAAITRYVTHFRYVAIPLGVNSYRPHAAVNVWQNHYGDCKDKANLLNTMLATLGYKTSLVLVPRFSQASDDLPGFAFNHAIAAVQLNGETLWLDSTDDVCRFGLLPPGDPGRKVLVINGSTKLTQLPPAVAGENQLSLETKVTLPEVASAPSQIDLTAQSQGYADYLLRVAARETGPRSIAPLLVKPFAPTSGAFEPTRQETTDVADLDPTFSWKAQGIWTGLVAQLPQSSTRLVRLPAWLPREWTLATLPRTTPLQLNQGYPMMITQTWVIHLPKNASAVKAPETQTGKSDVLPWRLTWDATASGEVTAKLELSLLKADLSPEETRDFQTSCHHLQEVLQDGFSYQPH